MICFQGMRLVHRPYVSHSWTYYVGTFLLSSDTLQWETNITERSSVFNTLFQMALGTLYYSGSEAHETIKTTSHLHSCVSQTLQQLERLKQDVKAKLAEMPICFINYGVASF